MAAARLPDIIPGGEWIKQAACAGANPELFFPDKRIRSQTEQARAICKRCPVRTECLMYALDANEEYGIWGGCIPEERRLQRRLLRNRNNKVAG